MLTMQKAKGKREMREERTNRGVPCLEAADFAVLHALP